MTNTKVRNGREVVSSAEWMSVLVEGVDAVGLTSVVGMAPGLVASMASIWTGTSSVIFSIGG